MLAATKQVPCAALQNKLIPSQAAFPRPQNGRKCDSPPGQLFVSSIRPATYSRRRLFETVLSGDLAR